MKRLKFIILLLVFALISGLSLACTGLIPGVTEEPEEEPAVEEPVIKEPTTNTLAVGSTDGGEVAEPGEGAFDYDEGAVVTLTANPAEGWEFDGWSGETSGTDLTTTVTMDGDKSVTVTFVEEPVAEDKIAFTSYRDGGYDIFIMGADGTDQNNLTNNPVSYTHLTLPTN